MIVYSSLPHRVWCSGTRYSSLWRNNQGTPFHLQMLKTSPAHPTPPPLKKSPSIDQFHTAKKRGAKKEMSFPDFSVENTSRTWRIACFSGKLYGGKKLCKLILRAWLRSDSYFAASAFNKSIYFLKKKRGTVGKLIDQIPRQPTWHEMLITSVLQAVKSTPAKWHQMSTLFITNKLAFSYLGFFLKFRDVVHFKLFVEVFLSTLYYSFLVTLVCVRLLWLLYGR